MPSGPIMVRCGVLVPGISAAGVILGPNEACPGCDAGRGWPVAAACAAAAAFLAATSSFRGRPRLRRVGVCGISPFVPATGVTWT